VDEDEATVRAETGCEGTNGGRGEESLLKDAVFFCEVDECSCEGFMFDADEDTRAPVFLVILSVVKAGAETFIPVAAACMVPVDAVVLELGLVTD
jgi:hypothetical protein